MIIDEPVRGRYAYLEHPWLFAMPPHEQMRPFIERRCHFHRSITSQD